MAFLELSCHAVSLMTQPSSPTSLFVQFPNDHTIKFSCYSKFKELAHPAFPAVFSTQCCHQSRTTTIHKSIRSCIAKISVKNKKWLWPILNLIPSLFFIGNWPGFLAQSTMKNLWKCKHCKYMSNLESQWCYKKKESKSTKW